MAMVRKTFDDFIIFENNYNKKTNNNVIKNINRRLAALAAAGLVLCTSAGCSKKTDQSVNSSVSVTATVNNNDLMHLVKNSLKKVFPNLTDEVLDDSSIIILLNLIAQQDENGKISAENISKYKNIIDSENMMSNYNSLLDTLEQSMVVNKQFISISSVLPDDLKDDKLILSNIESITKNIMNSNNQEQINFEFNKIYTLFVDEERITVNGIEFEVRDLSYSSRVIADSYARTAAYFAKNYITDEQYKNIDKRTNNQNSKAYIKTTLEILSNEMNEKSELNIVPIMNAKYNGLHELIKNKVLISAGEEKNLINYLNLEYINSSKVSTKDKNEILNDYDDSNINSALLNIDAMMTYNLKNENGIISFSNMLLDEYKTTEKGQIDSLALDFVQFNSTYLLKTINNSTSFIELYNNPYFQNLYKYFTKQNFTHKYKDENGNVINKDIVFQEISGGVNLYNNEIILFVLNKLPKVDNMDTFITLSQQNLGESIQYVQNRILGECKKVDSKEFIKTK